jgi:hypothetical protein
MVDTRPFYSPALAVAREFKDALRQILLGAITREDQEPDVQYEQATR